MTAPVRLFVADSLPAEVRRFLDRVAELPDVVAIAVMPDVHLAGEACVGTAIATRGTLRPALLGSDLGCGVAALPLGGHVDVLDRSPVLASDLLDAIRRAVPLDRRPTALAPRDAVLDAPLSTPRLQKLAEREGRIELGTVGRGNHFVELQRDEDDGTLWLMVHTGSRAMGPAIQAHHEASAPRPRDAVLDATSPAGHAYLSDVGWALEYARVSRRVIAVAVAEVAHDLLGIEPDLEALVDCHHDAVSEEEHAGERVWVHRKGAVHAALGAPVLVPGSMGTASFHAEGRGHAAALTSSAHGAGRAVPRGEARRRFGPREIERQLAGVLVHPSRLRDLGDEVPDAYKDVRAVMRAQRDLVRVVRRLRPVLVHK